MQEILAVDEYKRDLLMLSTAADDARETVEAARRIERREAKAHELHDAIRRMRMQAIRSELERLAGVGLHDPDALASYRRLVDEQNRLVRDA